ncbi:glycosyltransferase [Tritonibacter scottomollicae]|uniref:Glycosyl transferase family 2 n=1 Tax=Tritonibacter scottomollicae TaxID=483013 RepID=A0A2T1ANY0_TRISK|nr:glycosyltransferase [Tritonibacter scottomollicae]PRZ50272.1 glycosyl transferase family 2 [Tritonibacter scottomollicae]
MSTVPPPPDAPQPQIDAVVIGRNEGERLLACLDSLAGQVRRIIYVDSGSSDGSVAAAKARGAEVVQLDMSRPFTAARARNAGLDRLSANTSDGLVQFLDGDCSLDPGWLRQGADFLAQHPDVAVACGRRREQNPSGSIYNWLCDLEWDTPIGEAKACGGDALMRRDAIRQVGGYRDTLIAGEEPELCVRLRKAGWKIWRLDEEMTRHDAQMTQFSQWWKRARRAGHAFAEGAHLHGAPPECHWVAETRRAMVWGAVLPGLIALTWSLLPLLGSVLSLIYPLQFLRLSRRDGPRRAWYSMLGKFAEAQGVVEFHLNRLRGRHRALIEYK